MTTNAALAPNLGSPRRYIPVKPVFERVFYSGMAIVLCACVYIGFSPTYFGAGMMSATLRSPILHVHGAVFTLWMALFIGQTALISARRVKWHRSLGTVAFCLPPLMVVLGTWAGIDAMHRGAQIGPLDPLTSLAVPLLGIAVFSVVIYASWRTRRRPDAHKRLILMATIELTGAAFGRFPWDHIGLRPAAGATTDIGVLLLLLILYETHDHPSDSPLNHVGGAACLCVHRSGCTHRPDTGLARFRSTAQPLRRDAHVARNHRPWSPRRVDLLNLLSSHACSDLVKS